ncbi:MAG: hypothetical protein K0M40_00600 [Prolixibacteraceae bacterium]|nr:hypothetical protein [Prolixibacteraceae bacterium]
MKKILILLLSALFLVPAFAQRGKKDIVYLKSGGIIKGELITNDAEIVKINSSGNQWVFKNEEVDSISKYSKVINEPGITEDYFFDTSMGVLLGNSGNNQSAPFSFMSSVNFRINGNLYAGGGLGAEFFEESYMPAFAQIQYKFRDTKFTPFVNLQAGYQVPLEDGNRNQIVTYALSSSYYQYPQTNSELNAEGGYLINPSIGFQRFTSDNFGWFFSFGYRYHQLNYSGENGYKLETNFSRLSLKIGFIFN